VARLVTGWDLSDPNPGEYGAALQRMAQAKPVARLSSGVRYEAEPLRVLQIAIETTRQAQSCGARSTTCWRSPPGTPRCSICWSARLRARWQLPSGRAWRRPSVWRCGSRPNRLTSPSPAALRRGSTPPWRQGRCSTALATAESRATRRALLDRLARLGSPIVPVVIARLGDERW